MVSSKHAAKIAGRTGKIEEDNEFTVSFKPASGATTNKNRIVGGGEG